MSMAKEENGSMVWKLGERATSDVIVRLRTSDGRDDWFYSHSAVLCEKSNYFAARLSDDWPTCHLLDSRNCIDLVCLESEVDYYVSLLRILYIDDGLVMNSWHNVKCALGILKVAAKLGCDAIVEKCVKYLEAVPWEENEEEEILKILPTLGPIVVPVLARLQPVDADSVRNVFLSALRVATTAGKKAKSFLLESFPSDLKVSAQEQVEYMLVEDDDAPLLIADDNIKKEFRKYFLELFECFKLELEDVICSQDGNAENEGWEEDVFEVVSDLAWASRILSKVNLLDVFVQRWADSSNEIISILKDARMQSILWNTKFKVVELTAKVLDAVGYGSVLLPADKRAQLVKVWLPYIREIKPVFEANFSEGRMSLQLDSEMCQSIESAFVSLILSLPSVEQAAILAEWLNNEQTRYPDLSEAFEVWCFRSKAAKRRLTSLGMDGLTNLQIFGNAAGSKSLVI